MTSSAVGGLVGMTIGFGVGLLLGDPIAGKIHGASLGV